MNISDCGPDPQGRPAAFAGTTARVTAVHRGGLFETFRGQKYDRARLKPGFSREKGNLMPAVGDFVLLEPGEGGELLIARTLPRKTCLFRLGPSPSGREQQILAANFDYVWLMQSLGRDFNPRRLERYLALAWQSGARPVILLTKADLAEDPEPYLQTARDTAPGAEVLAVSVKTGYGLDGLQGLLQSGKTAVLLGSSGVGKSTLINFLAGEERLATGAIREKDGRGKHTTTYRRLITLPNGAAVIDTPGMRELGMWDAQDGLDRGFADIERYFGQCRFRDCRHRGEPGCAVAAAVSRGELPRERWESYLKLCAENRFIEDKREYRREKQKRSKALARQKREAGKPPAAGKTESGRADF